MVNPVSSIPTAQPPQAGAQIVNPNDGTMLPLFYRLILSLWQRTGSASGSSTTDSQTLATLALQTATEAEEQATATQAAVETLTTQVSNLAIAVQSINATANNALNAANTAQSGGLLRVNNLSDVTSTSAARNNLGLTTVPAVFQFDTLPSGLKRGVPLVQSLRVPANFGGTVVWWDVAPTSDSVFHVATKLQGAIGTVTIAAGGTGVLFSVQPAVTLASGDTLILQCPSPADSSLARMAMTFALGMT